MCISRCSELVVCSVFWSSANFQLQERGFEPSALTNAVAMLGASWRGALSAKGEPLSDYMTMEDMIRNVRIFLTSVRALS